ncbi:hypothetical protein F7Q99_36395 [Streptomyces kaniharaensis]|uniref:Helix-turn-helix domain-containing protein n=1 Tax=Streptomyces kaniharaensis TaxID=212423 RepID=A0A6N7L638_9ACTN|nr:hypothetical protein [Streptomyces kaniharaensis]MQS17523.1 hypothetical protein [Streptomyces kaniharaensis]
MTDFLTGLSLDAQGNLVPGGLDYIEFDVRLARDGSCPTVTKAAYMALASFANIEDHTTLTAEAVAAWSDEVRRAMLPYRKTLAACIGRTTKTLDRATTDLVQREFLIVTAQSTPGNPAVADANHYRLVDQERWARQLLERSSAALAPVLTGPDGRPLPRVQRDPGIDYVKLDARLVRVGERSPNYKAVYAAAASFTNINNRATSDRPPTLRELMACTGLSRSVVCEALAQLREDGVLLTRDNYHPADEGGGRAASSYLLLDARLWRRRAAARDDLEMNALTGGWRHEPDGGGDTTRTGVATPAGPGWRHEPDPNKSSNKNRDREPLPDARRASTAGKARETRAAAKTTPRSGSAATTTKKPRTKTIRTTATRPLAGEEEVFAAIDALGVSKHPAIRVPPLRRAVRDLLGAGRSPEHALARISDGWWKTGAPERIARGEIRGPVGYLAAVLSRQDCERPDCERGIVLSTGEECRACGLRETQRQAEHARRRLDAENQALDLVVAEEPGPLAVEPPAPAVDPVTWRCQAPGPDGLGTGICGRPGRGTPPALPMCPDCLESLHSAMSRR